MTKKHSPLAAPPELWHWQLVYSLRHVRGDKTWHDGQYELRTHRFRAADLNQAKRFALEHLQQLLRNNERLELAATGAVRLAAANITPACSVCLLKQYHSRGKLLHVKLDCAANCFSAGSPA